MSAKKLSYFGQLYQNVAVFWTKWRSNIILAVRSLWLHKLRAILSVLGIIIGTGAVITLMGFGEGSMQDALEDIKRQGATNVIVKAVKPTDEGASNRRSFVAKYGLTYDDYDRFRPYRDGGLIDSVVGAVPMRVFSQPIRRLDRAVNNGRLVATVQDYQRVNRFEVVRGRFLVDGDEGGEGDDEKLRNVAVVGSGVAEELFAFEDPIGKMIVMNRCNYEVVGVIGERAPAGSSGGSQVAEEYNFDVYIPLRTCRARYGDKVFLMQSGSRSGEEVQLHQITLTISDTENVRPAGDLVRDLLKRYHPKLDWAVTVPLDRLEEAERAKTRYLGLLFLIAAISLVVGGIGIMNILLATVTERTREIGIRRALGAKRRDIIMQFLVEAVVVTGLGGILGVATGITLLFGVPFLADKVLSSHVPARLNVPSIFISLSCAFLVGVVAGLYPAWKASRLDPIEALRHN